MHYVKTIDLASKYSYSRSTIYALVKEMEASDRYPKDAIIGSGRMRRVDADAFQDFMENLTLIRHPNMRRTLRPYKRGGQK